ncbi:CP2 transcription factor-domain-containing protein [Clohesyomyces aquaticus]|uniref:CP2 transcription factor-domain-containing protein n=1 Tax=Clohesyomyces aquaticus TaxID=1231657 RepID=A0A1Y1YZX1_9PLEO|nr:CP2 transcription factor-domain-containing protein [Clohesyomyces aquaticus]
MPPAHPLAQLLFLTRVRCRTNSQKPDEELLQSFKAAFPHVQTTRSQTLDSARGPSLTDALDVAHHPRHFGDHEDIKDQDPTPRGNNEPWRFTPSLLDPNSFAFASFANQPPGYYTPTPGGTNTLYHSSAGDLHTPGFSFGLGTPLSLPTSESGVHAGQPPPASHLHGFNPHALGTHHHFQTQNPFQLQPHHAASFAPHQFSHQPSPFDHGPLVQSHESAPMDNVMPDVEMQEHSPMVPYAPQSMDESVRPPLSHQPSQHFRYHVTLNAPTAMIKSADEIPVTYLNKGQAYTISLLDTQPVQSSGAPLKYRTYIRISFEDEQQRQRPAACWQLWKEGRGTNEAHQRGGRLQAVEFVDPTQVGGGEVQGRPRVVVENASFDGFVVTWVPVSNTNPECSLAVRFNFLSTDFSHSKGVKGIPVRLCAKTELLTGSPSPAPEVSNAELCYCKVKLFRDHGAERKLSNDIAHVKKTIDKLKQQIAQVESGMKDFGKRKRSGSISKASASSRPGKVPKHKRTWSMSSASSTTGTRPPAEEDLHHKLNTLQDMFSSTRPASVLYLKGDEADDPDLHPVQLSGTPQDLSKIDTNVDTAMWEGQSSNTGATSSIVSPTPSSRSLHSGERRGSVFQHPAPFHPPSRISSNEWRSMPQTATGDLKTINVPAGSDIPTKVQRPYGDDHTLSGWIEALGVDQTYQPPPEPMMKPVACFFVQPRVAGKQPDDNYFRAVYLMERTVKALAGGIAMKINIEPTKVTRTIRVNQKGLQILLDDEAVQEIPEQQDMTAEFHEITPPQNPVKREWDAGPTDIQVDGDVGAIENVNSTGYELRLLF